MEDVLVTVKDWSEEDEQMEREMIEELGKKIKLCATAHQKCDTRRK